MPVYVTLVNVTDQGMKNVKDWPNKVKEGQAAVEKAGGKWLAHYFTFGQYDAVAILELPNDEVAMTTLLAIGTQGNIRTTTLKAFTTDEIAKIVKRLP